MSKYHKLFWLLIIPLVIVGTIVVFKVPMVRGLDLDGGMRVLLQADPKDPADWPVKSSERIQKMGAIRDIIQNRVKGLQGVAEPKIQVQDDDKLAVELPGVLDPEKAKERIQSTAALEFYYLKDVQTPNNPIATWKVERRDEAGRGVVFVGPRGETIDSEEEPKAVLEKVVNVAKNKPILTGKDLLPKSKSTLDPNQRIVIEIKFNEEGTKIFRDFTRDHVDEYLAVFFEGKLLTAPTIKEPIPSGDAEISGFDSLQEARETADLMNAGALPVPLKVIDEDRVEPTLGKENVSKAIMAGIWGLILVGIFMIIYYRMPGVLAVIALGLYALFAFAFFKAVSVTMSLAGLAAFILSVGMAVDANILIFERLKEELRGGKTLRAAIDAGFNRAFTAIFDSNICTAITCVILMTYGTPKVESFGLTLLVGVAISMFTAITVTRTLLHLLVGWEWAHNPALFGLGTSWMARVGFNLDVVGKRVWYFIISLIVILPGVFYLAQYGLKPGIEFLAGTELQARFTQGVELAAVQNAVEEFAPGSEVQLAKGDDGEKTIAFIKTRLIREDMGGDAYDAKIDGMLKALDSKFGIKPDEETDKVTFAAVRSVEPSVSKELTKNAVLSIVFASAVIVLYLTGRFAIGGLAAGFKYGMCAILAVIHDSAFILGLFAILGKLRGWEVDSLFVTAVLTTIGYSIHDSIVVFDRVRENLRHRQRGETYEQLCNKSILQTFSRSINTSLTVVLVLAALLFFGGPELKEFYVALLAGVVIGTYSSIFIATPLLVMWDRIGGGSKTRKRAAFESKAVVSEPVEETVAAADTDTQIEAGPSGVRTARPARPRRKKKKK